MDYPSYNDNDDGVIIIIKIIMIKLIILRSQWTGAGSVRCACGVALSACEFPSIRSKPHQKSSEPLVIISIIIIIFTLTIITIISLSACEFPSIRSKPHQKFDDTLIFYKIWIGIITFLDLLQITY